jgi:hypothetical protein
MDDRRVQQRCDGDILLVECADHAGFGLLLHVDVRTYESGHYLGAWSIEGQEALDGLLLTEALAACLERLTYKRT